MAKNVRAIKKRSVNVGIPVRDAVNDFLNDPKKKRLEETTRAEHVQRLGVFATWCAEHCVLRKTDGKTQRQKWVELPVTGDLSPVYLHHINDQVIDVFLDHLKETHTPSKKHAEELSSYTLAGYTRVIKTFLNWCVLDEQYCEHIKAITVKRIEKPQVIEEIIEVFSLEDLDALFAACSKEESEHLQMRDKAILAILLDAGLRVSELCTLTIGNVCLDPKDAHVKIFGKGRKWGEVPLGEKSRRNIQKYLRTFREPTIEYAVAQQNKNTPDRQLTQLIKREMDKSTLIVGRSGKPMTRSGVHTLIERLGQWAGIDDFAIRCSPHTFRHTFAYYFMRNGGDIYQLSRLLRHSSVKTTEIYLKSLKPHDVRQGAQSVLDNLS
ncbi:tyrosine recombinase XerC [Ktedonobacteria bacterium brp13]|nr:tyrosine recombinase XerC [Ktedonobacteria bacterium brp13]